MAHRKLQLRCQTKALERIAVRDRHMDVSERFDFMRNSVLQRSYEGTFNKVQYIKLWLDMFSSHNIAELFLTR
jgi:hypothetical protein